jgi:hypothetical protein
MVTAPLPHPPHTLGNLQLGGGTCTSSEAAAQHGLDGHVEGLRTLVELGANMHREIAPLPDQTVSRGVQMLNQSDVRACDSG